MHAFDWIYTWVIESALSPRALVVVAVCCFVDGFFPPIPSESVITALAAVLATKDPGRIAALVPLAAAGAFCGDNVAYLIGSRLHHLLNRFPKLRDRVHDASLHIRRRGATLIITARFIPVGRVAVNMGAGLAGYPHRRFMGVTAISASIWALYAAGIGVAAGRFIHDQPLLGAAIGVVLGVAIGTIVDRIISARQRRALRDAHETEASEASGA